MEKMGKRFGVLLAAALILACFTDLHVEAADGGYTYTVRLYAGQQGLFPGGQDVIILRDIDPGSTVSFNPDEVILNNGSKYYVKGIRESGRDNNTVSASSFTVYRDMDYVVAYGLRGNMVAYTVSYVDISGNKLAPTDTYYGNVGDKPVIAFLYIDGYQPQAYNLTKTLVENEAENAFIFVYTSLTGSLINETVTGRTSSGTERSVVEVIPGTSGRSTDTANLDGDANGRGAGGDTLAQSPMDMIDLDTMTDEGIYIEEPAVPLSDMKFKLGPIEVDARMLLVIIVILISGGAIAAASYWYWKPYRKKEKNDEKIAAQPV